MPTGYTAFIEDGSITTGKEFLLLCLRAFGIAIDIRNKPLSVPTPTTFKPDEYYKKRYDKAVADLETERNITFEETKHRMRSNYNEHVKNAKNAIARISKINEQYKKVREQVSDWTPPTEKHNGIKKFALEQIDMCINSDYDFKYYQEIIDTPFDDSDEAIKKYMAEYIKYLETNVELAKEAYDKEVRDSKEKTQFMKDFIESLENL